MRLRNKKTGEIIIPTDYTFSTYDDGIRYGHHIYYSLAELNEEWEDAEDINVPLIKNEKVRKVVRAWAEVNATPEVQYDRYGDCICSPYGSDRTGTTVSISFDDIYALKELKHLQMYTIAELCGEEE